MRPQNRTCCHLLGCCPLQPKLCHLLRGGGTGEEVLGRGTGEVAVSADRDVYLHHHIGLNMEVWGGGGGISCGEDNAVAGHGCSSLHMGTSPARTAHHCALWSHGSTTGMVQSVGQAYHTSWGHCSLSQHSTVLSPGWSTWQANSTTLQTLSPTTCSMSLPHRPTPVPPPQYLLSSTSSPVPPFQYLLPITSCLTDVVKIHIGCPSIGR